jgi:hypothetical protein
MTRRFLREDSDGFIGRSDAALNPFALPGARRRPRPTFRYHPVPAERKLAGSAESMRRRTPGRVAGRASAAFAAAVVALFVAVWPAVAQETAPPVVDLDKLRKLPSSLEFEPANRGSASKGEWMDRFETARSELAEARDALAKTKAKLAEAPGAGSAWQMAAPGMGGDDPGSGTRDQPLDYNLAAELRRNREEVARCERRLTELEIEANLAGVPDDWRGEPPEDAAAQSWE